MGSRVLPAQLADVTGFVPARPPPPARAGDRFQLSREINGFIPVRAKGGTQRGTRQQHRGHGRDAAPCPPAAPRALGCAQGHCRTCHMSPGLWATPGCAWPLTLSHPLPPIPPRAQMGFEAVHLSLSSQADFFCLSWEFLLQEITLRS